MIDTYDATGKFKHEDVVKDEEIASVAGNSLGGVMTVKILLDIITTSVPSLTKPLVKLLTGGMDKNFVIPEFKKSLNWLELQLGNADWFMGDRLGRADFLMIYPIDMICVRKWVVLDEFPNIKAWRERVLAREAWKRGLEKGNGYNLAAF